MYRIRKIFAVILVCAVILSCAGLFSAVPEVFAETTGKWVTAWTTSTVNGSIDLGDYVSGIAFQDFLPARSTIRTELKVTIAGSKLRFKFSNEYGAAAITINEASVAKTLGSGEGKIVDGTQTVITFNSGETSVTIPAGKTVWSDEIDFETQALESISVSLFFNNMTYITSTGLSGGATYLGINRFTSIFSSEKSQVNNPSLKTNDEITISSGSMTYHTIPFLCNIETRSSAQNACTAVFIGDSTFVNNTYLYFAEKLISAGVTNISVVNEAIIGNKLLSDGSGLIGNLYGDSLLSRFERDALNLKGVKYIFVKIGLNDILHQYTKSMADSTLKASAEDIIKGYEKLVELAHAKGIKIYFFTRSPWKNYEREFLGQSGDLTWSMEAQEICNELTQWVKTNTVADGYIDTELLSDPSDPYALCSSFTLDGVHLSELGSIAMADMIPLKYIGVTSTNVKTAAEINSVDPYKERNEILKQLEASKETTTQKEELTTKNEETTVPVENTTVPEITTIPEYTTDPENTILPEITTVPEYTTAIPEIQSTLPYEEPVVTNPQNTPNNQNTSFTPSDTTSEVTSIGNGAHIGFMLVLFMVIILAGTVVILTISHRKQEEEAD